MPAAIKVFVICSVERVFAHEDATNYAFGLNLSIGSDGVADLKDKIFRPWAWNPVKDIQYVSELAGGTRTFKSQSVFSLTWKGKLPENKKNDSGYSALITEIENLAPRADSRFTGAGGTPQVTVLKSDPNQLPRPVWPALLADLSLRPAPVPHVLNLAFFLKIPKDANVSAIWLAPIIPANVLGNASPILLNKTATPPPGDVGDWDYDPSLYDHTIVQLYARTQRTNLVLPASTTTFLDLHRLVVKPGNAGARGKVGGSNFNEDWRASLEHRLATALDYPRVVRDSIEKQQKKLSSGQLKTCLQMAIGALRDIAGVGLYPSPNGQRLLSKYSNPPDWQKVQDEVKKDFGKLDDWSSFLRNVLPHLNSLDIWAPSDRVSVNDALSQLDRLYSAVLEPNGLAKVVEAQVKAIATTLGGNPTFPSTLDWRNELLLENLGWYWQSLRSELQKPANTSQPDPDTDTARANLDRYLNRQFQARFSGDVGRYPTVDGSSVLAILKPDIDAWSQRVAAQVIPDSIAPTDQQQLGAHGLTFQVDALRDSNTGSSADDAKDILRQFRGVGLLLQRETDGPWRCLNLGQLAVQTATSTTEVEPTALIPNRIVYQNQLNQATLTYDNNPMSGQGPLACGTNVQLNDINYKEPYQLLAYRYSAEDKARLTPLIFGKSYAALPFLVSNAGILPPGIGAAGSPIELAAPPLKVPANIANCIRPGLSYKRFVGIGRVRLFDKNGRQELAFPRIPQNVFPKVRENQAPTDPNMERVPLVLLSVGDEFKSEQPLFSFSVRPPAVDINTWDRFVNGSERGTAVIRKQAWCGYLQTHEQNRGDHREIGTPGNSPGAAKDSTLDDPAIEHLSNSQVDRRFYVSLLDESGTPVCCCFVRMKDPGQVGLTAFQVPQTKITITVDPGGKVYSIEDEHKKKVLKCDNTAVLTDNIVFTVPNLSISSIQISVCVHSDHAQRFNGGLPAGDQIQSTQYYKAATRDILVEVADPGLPVEEELWNSFQINQTETLSGVATVQLRDTSTLFRNVYRAEVSRQVWKWSGRPVHPPLPPENSPTTKATADITTNPQWEVAEFGWRYDFDNIILPMSRTASDTFSYVERFDGKNGPLDLKATYLRFAVRVYSRYAGILANAPFRDAVITSTSPWKSCFVPCRKFVGIKPPDVKLILPLTESTPGDPGPGLMVLLRGPWFQEGGLGESLEAVVETVPSPTNDPNDPKQKKVFYYQYGVDPILALANPTPIDAAGAGEIEFLTMTGPVGHTFDIGSDDPLFVNTSFLLPPPSIRVAGIKHQPWNFCRLHLKRVIYLSNDGSKKVESELTPSFWVQFLPPSSMFGDIDVSGLILQFVNGNQLQLATAAGVQVLQPTRSPIFTLYLVLTRKVMDAIGSQGQEEYVGVYKATVDGKTWAALGAAPNLGNGQFRARVIEIQAGSPSGPPSFRTADDLWDQMFRNDIDDKDRVRIVRISKPIDSAVTTPMEVLPCRTAAAASF